MNKKGSLKTLFIVFIVLLAIAFYPFMQRSIRERKPERTVTESLIDIETQNVDSITISKNGQSATLTKEEGGWMVNGQKAKLSEVTKFLESLSSATISRTVSTNPANQSSYGVTSELGTVVNVSALDSSYAYVIGSRGNTPNSFYVRSSDSDETYLAKGTLVSQINPNTSYWRDKTIVDISPEDLASIELIEDTSVFVDSDSDNWIAFNDVFSPLTAFDFLTDEERSEFDASALKYQLIITKADGTVIEMDYIYDDPSYWIKYQDEYYKVSETNFLSISQD